MMMERTWCDRTYRRDSTRRLWGLRWELSRPTKTDDEGSESSDSTVVDPKDKTYRPPYRPPQFARKSLNLMSDFITDNEDEEGDEDEEEEDGEGEVDDEEDAEEEDED